MQTWHVLYVLGGIAELAGIVALGYPDLLPGARRISGWLRRQENRIRRYVGLPTRPNVVNLGAAAGEFNIAGRAAALVVSRSEGTLEQNVDFLLRRDQDAQRRENEMAERIDQLEADSRQRVDDARREMEQHVAGELADAGDEYRELRVVGTGALVLGLVLVTVATFIA